MKPRRRLPLIHSVIPEARPSRVPFRVMKRGALRLGAVRFGSSLFAFFPFALFLFGLASARSLATRASARASLAKTFFSLLFLSMRACFRSSMSRARAAFSRLAFRSAAFSSLSRSSLRSSLRRARAAFSRFSLARLGRGDGSTGLCFLRLAEAFFTADPCASPPDREGSSTSPHPSRQLLLFSRSSCTARGCKGTSKSMSASIEVRRLLLKECSSLGSSSTPFRSRHRASNILR